MLTDILWEVIAAAIYNRIATLINYISRSSIPGSHIKKNPPIKLITDGFNCLLFNLKMFLLHLKQKQ